MPERNGRLLLVSDDENLAIELNDILTRDRHLIGISRNASAALRNAATSPQPDLILLDQDLPDLDSYVVCRRLKGAAETSHIPIILIIAFTHQGEEQEGLDSGVADFVSKPLRPAIVRSRINTHLSLVNQGRRLEHLVGQRTQQLEETQEALRKAMQNLLTTQVTPGVYWVQVPEAGIYILCGCPGEVVKHLMRQGYIKTVTRNGKSYETGPNVILLSDVAVQNGGFANLAEFPVLQMLYRQGMMLPDHPNNTDTKPTLIGSEDQLHAQLEYIHRGNYGLVTRKEIISCGVDEGTADSLMRIKKNFAFGEIRPPAKFVDTLVVDEQLREIREGVMVQRCGFNRFRFEYRGHSTEVDLRLPPGVVYERPYPLDNHRFKRHYFAVLHSGDGDGWDINRPSMSSVIMYQGRIFLIDAGPGITHALSALGIDISEVEGIFHTHCHDDHFAGLPALVHSDHRLKYYATPLVRESVVKKLNALMSLGTGEFERFFDIHDLVFDSWNDCDGLEVMPIFSPHPVETNTFLFRALDENGYRSYAHWADLTSFEVLDQMAREGPNQVSRDVIDKVKSDYLWPADLKKIDIGGGIIHGKAEDFRNDRSGRLILAHVARQLTMEEMEIGSESSFGALDVLINGQQDYPRKHALEYLRQLFPKVKDNQFLILLNSPVIEQNAGTIIRRAGERAQHMDMVLSGTVAYINTNARIRNNLSFGSFLGDRCLFNDKAEDEGTYRAVSHCSVLRISNAMMRTFLENNQLYNQMREVTSKVWALRKTWLFGGQTSFLSLGNIVREMLQFEFEGNRDIDIDLGEAIWLVDHGGIIWMDQDGEFLQQINAGDFLGEHSYMLKSGTSDFRYRTVGPTRLFRIELKRLLDIPVVYWKILETISKRQTMLGNRSH
jgi:CheY-like chemotaxis protein